MRRLDHKPFTVKPGSKVSLAKMSTKAPPKVAKKSARKELADDVSALSTAQDMLWASGQYAVLIVFQALDAAGKDGTIKHVMTGINPQGCNVYSFGPPSAEELKHHFLWRPQRFLPGRGQICIFNRSYYEEVLVVRVHPKLLEAQHLPPHTSRESIWDKRFEDINAFEHTLTRNGGCVIKFFLHVSKDEQKKRFLERLDNPDKNWKFSASDIRERRFWDSYVEAYQDMLAATSTRWAPWYVIPADNKWFTRMCVADIIAHRIEQLQLDYPKATQDQLDQLGEARQELEGETK